MEIHKTRKKKVAVYAATDQYTTLRPGMAFPVQHRTLRFVEEDGHTTLISLDKEDVVNLIRQLSCCVDDMKEGDAD